MKILKVFLLSFTLLLVFGIAQAEEATQAAEAVALDENVTAGDLNIAEPKLLPDSPFYFLKNWGREIQSAFTFNSVKKVELREKFANEKLIELKKVVEKNEDVEMIKEATENYQKEVEKMEKATERIKEKAQENDGLGQFLDKFIQQQVLHQKALQKLENQVPEAAFEKIREAKEKHLESFGQVMTRLENKENIQERLENNLQQVKGSEFKDFKNIEILKDLEEKAPEAAKQAIQNVRANSLMRLKEKIEQIPEEKIEQFKIYTENISGEKEKQVEILDSLKEELKTKPVIKEMLIQSRERVLEQVQERIRERTATSNCPQIERPAPDFCQDGRIVVKKDDAGCAIGFKCVIPAETQLPPEPTTECIALYDPVCGQDGKIYSNTCWAKAAGVGIASRGECQKAECRKDADCPPSICVGAQTKCINGECIVPICVEQLPIKPIEPEDCAQVVIFRQNPETGECQQFSSPCQAPKDWKECNAAKLLPIEPSQPEECIQIIVYRQNPRTGECQQFSSPCQAPSNWVECNEAESLPIEVEEPNLFQKNIIEPIKKLAPFQLFMKETESER